MDHVSDSSVDKWNIFQVAGKEDIETIESMPHGTMIVWDSLDRIVEKPINKKSEDHFLSIAAKVKRHTEIMVFHRYLEKRKTKDLFQW